MATRQHGNTATRQHGNTATRQHGNTATRQHGRCFRILAIFVLGLHLGSISEAQTGDPSDPNNWNVSYSSVGQTDAYFFSYDEFLNVTAYHYQMDWATGARTLNGQPYYGTFAIPFRNHTSTLATISCDSSGIEKVIVTWIGSGNGPGEVTLIVNGLAKWGASSGYGSANNGLNSPLMYFELPSDCHGQQAHGYMLRKIKLSNKTGTLEVTKAANAVSTGGMGTTVWANAKGLLAVLDTRDVRIEMNSVSTHYKAAPNGPKAFTYVTQIDTTPKDGYHFTAVPVTSTYNGYGPVPVELEYGPGNTNFAHWDMGLPYFDHQLLVTGYYGVDDPLDPLYPPAVSTQFLGYASGSLSGFSYSWSDGTNGTRPEWGNWDISPISTSKLPPSQIRHVDIRTPDFPAVQRTWYEYNDAGSTYTTSLGVNWTDGAQGKAVREIHLHSEAEVNAQVLAEFYDPRAGWAPFKWFVFASGQEWAPVAVTAKEVVIIDRDLEAFAYGSTVVAIEGLVAAGAIPQSMIVAVLISAAMDQDVFFKRPQSSTEILNRDGHDKLLDPVYYPSNDPIGHRSNINNYSWKCEYRLGKDVTPTITNMWYEHGFGGQVEEPLKPDESLFRGYRRYHLKCSLLHPNGGGGGVPN